MQVSGLSVVSVLASDTRHGGLRMWARRAVRETKKVVEIKMNKPKTKKEQEEASSVESVDTIRACLVVASKFFLQVE